MSEERISWLGKLRLFKEKESPPSLKVEEGGFSYVGRDETTTVNWSDVKEAFAFKRDIFSVDLICLGFRVSDDGRYWEIDEQMSGYEEVLTAMAKAFPPLDTSWWHKVAFPAFKTNLVTIWGQPRMAAIWELG
jgi:hypothetical protein